MSRRIVRSPRARLDVVQEAVWLGERSPEAAERFLDATERALRQLAEGPEIGAPRKFERPELVGLRMWRVPGFEKYLIFYVPISDGIHVLRVLHGARDIAALFGQQ